MSLVDRLDALERAGTPGPWRKVRNEIDEAMIEADGLESLAVYGGGDADADLSAESRNALRRLLDVVRAAEAHRRVGKDVYAGAVWIDCPSECYTATRRRCTLVAALDALNTETP